MFKFGLKLWSTNKNYIQEAERLYSEGVYQYIELYAEPGSYKENINLWQELKIPYVIHAPHFLGGVNLAKREQAEKNVRLLAEAQKFAAVLKVDKIIVHPGVDGDINETARQLKAINDSRILIENKPYHALDDGLICNGTSPEEIRLVMKEAGVGFCLDIGHAICSAKAHGVNYIEYLKEFISLEPQMYHLADGDTNNFTDDHRHIGKGNFDLEIILSLLPCDAMVTIETRKDLEGKLNDFVRDIEAIKSKDDILINRVVKKNIKTDEAITWGMM